jgi:putative PIN family toxin of toxin-antitoxin system
VVEGKKVVIDVNVFISAFGWGGKPLRVIELLEKGEIRNCISEEILIELCGALAYPKINFPQKLQSDILEFVLAHSDIYEIKEHFNITPDPKDNKFTECAFSAKAKFILTGDKSLLWIKQFRGIKIITPEGFLKSNKFRK